MPPELLREIAPKEAVNIKEDQYFQQVTNGANEFAFDMYQQMKKKQGNLLFSPFNVAIGINMVGLGAAGETASEIQKVLHYSLNLSTLIHDINQFLGANMDLSTRSTLSLTDDIWLQQNIPLMPSFQINLKRSFNATLQATDFENPSQALNAINNRIARTTKGKITQVLSAQDLTRDTRFILTTAFYFKAEWFLPFERRNTVKAPFNYKGHPFQVEMMKQVSDYSVLLDDRFEIVEIPFKKIAADKALLSMIIFLPKEEIELSTLELELNAQQWKQWMGQLNPQPIELNLPRFRVDARLDLSVILKAMGISQAFNTSANFSGISEKEKIFLNKAVHKILLRIEESGSDAGMAFPIRDLQKLENPKVIKVDRPFFFVIQEKETNLILCLGRILRP